MRQNAYLSLSLCLALPWLATCQSKKEEPKETVESKLSAEEQKKLDEATAEMEIGRNMAGRLLKFYGAYPDEKLNRYVNEVGTYVAKNSDFPDRRYMFEIYYADEVNAFACPGGYILISLGAIKNASNEAELAHVLGHEIAHVGKRHMYDTLAKMNEEEMKKASEASAKFEALPLEVRVRKRPVPEESSALAKNIARYMSGSSVGFNVLQAAKAGMSLITEKGLGAEKEFEADQEGTRYAINSGYDPKALINFLCRIETMRGKPAEYCLQKQEKKVAAASVLDKTHPSVPDRVDNIKKVLVDLKAASIVGAKGKKRYMEVKDRIKGAETLVEGAAEESDEGKE